MKRKLLLLAASVFGLVFLLMSGSSHPAYSQLYPTTTTTVTTTPPPTCTGVCRNICGSTEIPNGETCANLVQECCINASTVDCGSQGGECRGQCLTPSQVEGPGACTGINAGKNCCYPAPPPSSYCSSGSCSAYCVPGEVSTGICYNGTKICCAAAPTVPPGGTILCAHNTGCGVNGCAANQAWVQSEICSAWTLDQNGQPVKTNCTNAPNCVSVGGGCMTTTTCTGCHPSSCTNTCGLGGCASGCGSVDSCGGVSCSGCPGTTSGGNGGNGGSTSTPTNTATSTPTSTPIPNPGIVKARAVVVPTTASTCAEVAASSTYLPMSIGISPNVAPGYQSVSGGSYASWSVNQGTSSVLYVPASGYSLKISCFTGVNPASSGTGLSAFVNSNQTVTFDLGFSFGTSWMQSQGGDVYAANSIYSPVPAGAVPQYFSLDGAGGTPGVVTYGGDYAFDGTGTGLGEAYISSAGWLANEAYDTTDYYAIMYHRFGSPTTADYAAGATITSKPASRATPYYIPGNATIDTAAWNVASGEKIVLIVNGDLTINKPINITSGGFAAFIVNGNITVDTAVGSLWSDATPDLEGIFITAPGGTFSTGNSSSAGARRLVAKGTFVAGTFNLQRDLDADARNNTTAAELFIYNPELLIYMPDEMKDVPISWQEVAP